MYIVCMARVNVYLPDDLAAAAKASNLNVSALTQEAVRTRLAAATTDAWLVEVGTSPQGTVSHDMALAAMDAAREDAPTRHG